MTPKEEKSKKKSRGPSYVPTARRSYLGTLVAVVLVLGLFAGVYTFLQRQDTLVFLPAVEAVPLAPWTGEEEKEALAPLYTTLFYSVKDGVTPAMILEDCQVAPPSRGTLAIQGFDKIHPTREGIGAVMLCHLDKGGQVLSQVEITLVIAKE